jgi:hypothetical protein
MVWKVHTIWVASSSTSLETFGLRHYLPLEPHRPIIDPPRGGGVGGRERRCAAGPVGRRRSRAGAIRRSSSVTRRRRRWRGCGMPCEQGARRSGGPGRGLAGRPLRGYPMTGAPGGGDLVRPDPGVQRGKDLEKGPHYRSAAFNRHALTSTLFSADNRTACSSRSCLSFSRSNLWATRYRESRLSHCGQLNQPTK